MRAGSSEIPRKQILKHPFYLEQKHEDFVSRITLKQRISKSPYHCRTEEQEICMFHLLPNFLPVTFL